MRHLFIATMSGIFLFGSASNISEYNALKRDAISQKYSPKDFIKEFEN